MVRINLDSMKKHEKFKYKIEAYLQQLNVKDYSLAIKVIPKELNISANTFQNYRKLMLGSASDIPYILVRRLENIFKLERGGLENFVLEFKDLEALLKESRGSSV
jgi:hypothetical protein